MSTKGPKEKSPEKRGSRYIRKTDLRRGTGGTARRDVRPVASDGRESPREKLLEASRRLIEETREER